MAHFRNKSWNIEKIEKTSWQSKSSQDKRFYFESIGRICFKSDGRNHHCPRCKRNWSTVTSKGNRSRYFKSSSIFFVNFYFWPSLTPKSHWQKHFPAWLMHSKIWSQLNLKKQSSLHLDSSKAHSKMQSDPFCRNRVRFTPHEHLLKSLVSSKVSSFQ